MVDTLQQQEDLPTSPHHHQPPGELNLLHPLAPVKRVVRHGRSFRGQHHTIRLLERQQSSQVAFSSSSTTLAAARPSPLIHYRVDSVLMVQPKDVAILRCSPMMSCGAYDDEDPSCLMRCSSSLPLAVKVVPRSAMTSGGDSPLHEIAALQLLQNHQHDHSDEVSHVIHLVDCLEDEEFYYMMLPYLSGGDLFVRVNQTNGAGLPPHEAARYFRQMVKGLLEMKQQGLAHHDISLENACLDSHDYVKIIDLGMALRVPPPANNDGSPVILEPRQCCGKRGYVVSIV